jgi:hypothetical protein
MIVTDFLQLRCLFILIYRTVRDRALISVTRIVALHKLTTAAFTVWHANPIRCAAGCVDVAITPPHAWVGRIATLPTHNSVTPQPTRAMACCCVSCSIGNTRQRTSTRLVGTFCTYIDGFAETMRTCCWISVLLKHIVLTNGSGKYRARARQNLSPWSIITLIAYQTERHPGPDRVANSRRLTVLFTSSTTACS